MKTIKINNELFVLGYIVKVEIAEDNISMSIHTVLNEETIKFDTVQECRDTFEFIQSELDKMKSNVSSTIYVVHCKADEGQYVNVFKSHEEAEKYMKEELKGYVINYNGEEGWYGDEHTDYEDPDLNLYEFEQTDYSYNWTRWSAYYDYGSYPCWEISKFDI